MRSVFVCCLYSSRAAANVERKLSVLDVGIVWAGHSDKAVKNEEEHRPSLRRTCVNRIRTSAKKFKLYKYLEVLVNTKISQ